MAIERKRARFHPNNGDRRPSPISAHHSRLSPYVGPQTPYDGPQGGPWGVSAGEWGDGIAAVGISRRLGAPKGTRWLLAGSDRKLVDWLGRQTGAEEHSGHILKAPDVGTYMAWVKRACCETPAEGIRCAEELLALAGIQADEIYAAQVNYQRWPDPTVSRWMGPELSGESVEWAAAQAGKLGKFLLLHPYSNASTPEDAHWEGWVEGIASLKQMSMPVLITGRMWPDAWGPQPTGGSLVDMIGATPSMEHLLALTTHAKGVVTTSNCLSMWSYTASVKTVVMMNRALTRMTDNWFRRWIEHPMNELVPFGATQQDFHAAIGTLTGRG